jgi:hypothetical protein
MSQETIEQTFQVPTPAKLKLENVRGSVVIQPAEDGLIRVTAVKHLKTGDADQTKIEIEQGDKGEVYVKTRYREGGFFLFRRKPCKIDYLIRVPVECDLKVSGVSNSASIEGISGKLSISTVSGSLDLNKLSGSLKLTSVSGDLRGESLNGSLTLETVSGDVSLDESNLTEIYASTVSGDMVMQTQLGSGLYSFNSVSGDVHLVIPSDTHCTLKYKSISGDLKTSLPGTHSHHGKGQKTITIGDGSGAEILHNSISGDFLLTTTGDVEEQYRQVSAPIENHEDHMVVLERIERGEISVDEGLRELHS